MLENLGVFFFWIFLKESSLLGRDNVLGDVDIVRSLVLKWEVDILRFF